MNNIEAQRRFWILKKLAISLAVRVEDRIAIVVMITKITATTRIYCIPTLNQSIF